jgi:hypothetical protein
MKIITQSTQKSILFGSLFRAHPERMWTLTAPGGLKP